MEPIIATTQPFISQKSSQKLPTTLHTVQPALGYEQYTQLQYILSNLNKKSGRPSKYKTVEEREAVINAQQRQYRLQRKLEKQQLLNLLPQYLLNYSVANPIPRHVELVIEDD